MVILVIKTEEVIEKRGDRTVIAEMKTRDKNAPRGETVKREVRESLPDRQDTARIPIDYHRIKVGL